MIENVYHVALEHLAEFLVTNKHTDTITDSLGP